MDVRKLLIGALLLFALPSMGLDYAYEHHVIVGTASIDSIRAVDRGGANRFFDAYWTFINPTATDARAVVYRLDGTTGAPSDSTVILIPAESAFTDYVYGDSCQFTNWNATDSCQVYMRGTKPVDRYGR